MVASVCLRPVKQGQLQNESASGNVKARIRHAASNRYSWDANCAEAKMPLNDLEAVLPLKQLFRVGNLAQRRGLLNLSFLSEEYLQVGLHWLKAIQAIDGSSCLIIAGDASTCRVLKECDALHVEAKLRTESGTASYVSPAGFSEKGLAMTALKFPVVRALLKEGYDVTMSDADAIWLQNPVPHFPDDAALAFQRVAYFPSSIVTLWGFAACSGFAFFRSSPAVIAFIDACIRAHREVHSDQLALNLALLESDVSWEPQIAESPMTLRDEEEGTKERFLSLARFPIRGRVTRQEFSVCALPHHQFWRHEFVPAAPSEVIVFHPNSPKNASAKMHVLRTTI
ncbi:MAG: Nucleotide-diphospho-sugar transferase [Verrucomicrobiota bacterium]|jgi:hypothetical protein